MTTEAVTDRTPRRRRGAVWVELPAQAQQALIRLAVREDRDVDGQARRLIVEGLEREGLLDGQP